MSALNESLGKGGGSLDFIKLISEWIDSATPEQLSKISGPAGTPGDEGRDGINGRDGMNGPQGAQGPSGPSGPAGEIADPTLLANLQDTINKMASNQNYLNFTLIIDPFLKQWLPKEVIEIIHGYSKSEIRK